MRAFSIEAYWLRERCCQLESANSAVVPERNSVQLTERVRGVCPNQPAAIARKPRGGQRRRRHHVERLPSSRVTVLDRELEGLRHVVGVDVVQKLGAQARDSDLLAGG
jgi:hypothetical protein